MSGPILLASRSEGAGRAGKRRRRALPWLIAALVLAAGAALVFRCFFSFPVGSGPAGPSVSDGPFQRVWSERLVLLVGLGDSVTQGFGARRGYSYFDRLAANPEDEWEDMRGKCLAAVFPKLDALNLAVSGTTPDHHVQVQLPKLKAQPEDVLGIVVMTTGGNDLIHDYGQSPPREHAMYGATLAQAKPWVANYERLLNQMVLTVKARFPGGCHIFLANIYDPTDGTGSVGMTGLPHWPDGLKLLAAYNDVIARCAAKHDFVHLVDMHALFLGHGLHCTKF